MGRTIRKIREVSSNGVMDEGSGKIQKASAHPGGLIMVDLAAVQLQVAAIDPDSAALPNKQRKSYGKVIQRGDG